MELFNGSVTTIQSNINNQIFNAITNSGTTTASTIYYYGVISGETYSALSPTYSAETNVFGVDSVSSTGYDYTDPNNDPWYYGLFDNNSHEVGGYSGYSFYSRISSFELTSTADNCATFYNFSLGGNQGVINYNTNVINVCVPSLTSYIPSFTTCVDSENVTVGGVTVYSDVDSVDFSSGSVVFQLVSNDGTVTEEWTVNLTVNDPCNPCNFTSAGTQNTGTVTRCYQGTLSGQIFVYSGTPYLSYDDMVIATLRSRGVATYGSDTGAVYEVTGLTDVSIVTNGQYSGVTKNPFSTF